MCKRMLNRVTSSFLLLENKYILKRKKKREKRKPAEFEISPVDKYSILYLSSMKLDFWISRETYVNTTVIGISVSSRSFLNPCSDFPRRLR